MDKPRNMKCTLEICIKSCVSLLYIGMLWCYVDLTNNKEDALMELLIDEELNQTSNDEVKDIIANIHKNIIYRFFQRERRQTRPGAARWANDYDGPLHFECPVGQGINRLVIIHNNSPLHFYHWCLEKHRSSLVVRRPPLGVWLSSLTKQQHLQLVWVR